jgi:hypothetical protein
MSNGRKMDILPFHINAFTYRRWHFGYGREYGSKSLLCKLLDVEECEMFHTTLSDLNKLSRALI